MANARAASLQAQRSAYRNPLGSVTRRVLAPVNTGLSSIAKQNAINETEIMMNKYNSGSIGNDAMKTFLTTQLNSPYVSQSDKVDIQKQLQDFDVLIEKDRLEAVFKSAPTNSIEKMQAASALADFYTKRASTMVPGTPAYSTAQENAGTWTAQVQAVQESVNKQQLSNYEDKMLQEINKLPTSSSAKSAAMADMYRKLSDLAYKQGNVNTANEYAAKMEQQNTYAQQYQDAENAKKDAAYIKGEIAKKELELAKLPNKSLDEMKRKMEMNQEISDLYANLGDQINATKYLTKAVQAEEVYNKGLSTASSKELAKQSQTDDINYQENLRLIQEAYSVGKDLQGRPYGKDRYEQDMNKVISEREASVSKILETAQNGESVYWDGKTQKPGNVIDKITNELNNIQGMSDALAQGSLALFEVPPTSKMGKNIARYELKDTRFIDPKDQALIQYDSSGIGHIGQMGEKEISAEEYNNLGGSSEPTLSFNKSTGKYYQQTGLQYDMVDPISGAVIKQNIGEYGPKLATAQGIIEGEKQQLGVKPGEKFEVNPQKAMDVTANQTAMSAEQAIKSQQKAKQIKEGINNAPLVPQITNNKQTIAGIQTPFGKDAIINKAPLPYISGKVGSKYIEPATAAITQGVKTIAQTPLSKTVQQAVNTGPVGQILQAPAKINQAISTTAQNINKNVVQPTIQNVQKTVAPVVPAVQKAISTPSGQYAPVVNAAQAVQKAVSTPTGQYAPSAMIGNAVSNVANQAVKAVAPTAQKIGTAISGGVDWLKKKFLGL